MIDKRGYATNDEELRSGFRSIAAPLNLTDGTTIGALPIGGPAYRFKLTGSSVNRSVDILQNAIDNVKQAIDQQGSIEKQ